MAQPRTRLIPHVANKGFEQITMIVHGAINVPYVDDRIPRVYVTGQSRYTLATQEIGDRPNATNAMDGVNPVWNDVVFIETVEESADDEELIILLIDEPRNKNITEYRIPWKWLQPFYAYHLELIMASNREFSELKLYVSITRKQNLLSKLDFKYFGFEAFLNQFDVPLTDKQSMYAVGRIIPDYNNYKLNVLKRSSAIVETVSVVFPSPSYNSFIPKQFGIDGYPQISLAAKDGKNAVWKHDFLFSMQEEKDIMFVDDSALVIEFYPFRKLTKNWHLKDLLGWVAIRLDPRSYEALDSNAAKFGLKTDNMLVEGDGALIAESNKSLTCEVMVRLCRDKHPRSILTDASIKTTPILDSHYTEDSERNGINPVYLQSRFKGATKLPNVRTNSRNFQNQYIKDSGNVREKPGDIIVREVDKGDRGYRLIDRDDDLKLVPRTRIVDREPYSLTQRVLEFDSGNSLADIPPEYRLAIMNLRQPRGNDDLEEWFIYYSKLSNSLQTVIKRMYEDIISLKAHIRSIEASNIQLRSKMGNFEEKKYNLMKLVSLNEIDRAKVNEMFLELRTKLAVKTNEGAELREKIAILEREVERKKTAEIEYKKLMNAHKLQSQEAHLLQVRLSKAFKLEETVRRQEVVIERLENLIHQMAREKSRGALLSSENARIVKEVGDIKRYSPINRLSPYKSKNNETNSRLDDLEKKVNLNELKWLEGDD